MARDVQPYKISYFANNSILKEKKAMIMNTFSSVMQAFAKGQTVPESTEPVPDLHLH